MRTPIDLDNIRDWFVSKDRADMELFRDGFFMFLNFKNGGGVEVIGNINCRKAYKLYFLKKDKDDVRYVPTFYGYDFCFDDDLPIFKPEVKEGDVINIETMIDLEIPHIRDVNFDLEFEEKLKTIKFPYAGNIFMLSILIKLDPF